MMKHQVLRCVAASVVFASALMQSVSAAGAADLGGSEGAQEYQDLITPPHRHFYVRADIGIARNSLGSLSQQELSDNGGSFIQSSLADTTYIGAGVGVQMSRRLRIDLTGEYRASSLFKAMDFLEVDLTTPNGSLVASTLYQGQVRSIVGLLNAYWDLFSHRGFTPYLGAGVGFAHNSMSGLTTASTATFTDAVTGQQTVTLTHGTSKDRTQSTFAWALMAGAAFDLSANAKLDIGYRYLNLGSVGALTSGLLDCICGTVGAPLKVGELDAHELRIGIRWVLGQADMTRHWSLK